MPIIHINNVFKMKPTKITDTTKTIKQEQVSSSKQHWTSYSMQNIKVLFPSLDAIFNFCSGRHFGGVLKLLRQKWGWVDLVKFRENSIITTACLFMYRVHTFSYCLNHLALPPGTFISIWNLPSSSKYETNRGLKKTKDRLEMCCLFRDQVTTYDPKLWRIYCSNKNYRKIKRNQVK